MQLTRTVLTCGCGQKIDTSHIVCRFERLDLVDAPVTTVKYRCPRCRRMRMRTIPLDAWRRIEEAAASSEMHTAEKTAFKSHGPIEIDEVIDFHFALENLISLDDLTRPARPPRARRRLDSTR